MSTFHVSFTTKDTTKDLVPLALHFQVLGSPKPGQKTSQAMAILQRIRMYAQFRNSSLILRGGSEGLCQASPTPTNIPQTFEVDQMSSDIPSPSSGSMMISLQ